MNKLTYILFFLFSLNQLQAQDKCSNLLDVGYISDGQSYAFKFSNTEVSKMYITFSEGFTYQIATCSDKIIKFEIKIFDTQRKLLFSNTSDNYTKKWAFRFKSTVSCIAEFKALDIPTPKSQLKVQIGFK